MHDDTILYYTVLCYATHDDTTLCCTTLHHTVPLQVVQSKSIIMTAPGYVAAKLVGGDDGILPEASSLSEGESSDSVQYSIAQYSAVQYSTVQYSKKCSTVQYSTVPCSTV